MPRVLIAGHVTLDRFGPSFAPGGGAYYGARTYLGLGAQVRLATVVGTDFVAGLAVPGLEVSIERAGSTTVFTNEYPEGAPRVQRVDAIAPAVEPERLPPAWCDADVLHLAPVIGEIDLARWTRAVRAPLVGIGVQGWVRAAHRGAVCARPWAIDADLLRTVRVACVGEEDLVGQGDLLERLTALVPIVAFTHGVHGCEIIERGRTIRVRAYRTREIDPTGAGDTFASGFLLGLASGHPPIEAARLGAAAASIVVEAVGAEALSRVAEARGRVSSVEVEG